MRIHAGDAPREIARIRQLAQDWIDARSLLNSFVVTPPVAAVGAAKLDAAFEDFNAIARTLVAREVVDGNNAYIAALRPARTSRRNTLIAMGFSLVAAFASLAWLFRSVLPRARAYMHFAGRIAGGQFDEQLEVRGHDEIAELGRTLDLMAASRRRKLGYDSSQVEFTENMQLADGEAEAHRLLKRHLERSIVGSDVVILNRNNSQDRLEAVTVVLASSPLITSLQGAAPRSCLAIRQARTHESRAGEGSLLECSVCAGCDGHVTCTPFMVGGEVIGSVLINGSGPLAANETRRVRESVVQTAPVLANLRNLAIAETRAATDALTGLPNRRAIDATLLRMVAHAGRSVSPMSLLLFDLDHFKQVNDRFGHGVGDEVLAAVGAALRDIVRDGDFAGRYGGEEFIIALPDTGTEGGLVVAEKIRQAVAEIYVPSIDEKITTSVGVATLPDDAADASGLVRAADRALYLAKTNGRNRVESVSMGTSREPRNELVSG